MITTNEASGQTAWYRIGIDETVARLATDTASGLTSSEVSERQVRYGPNVLAGKEKETPLHAFLRQYQDLMQIILVVAAVVNQIVTGEAGTTIVLPGATSAAGVASCALATPERISMAATGALTPSRPARRIASRRLSLPPITPSTSSRSCVWNSSFCMKISFFDIHENANPKALQGVQ